MNRRRMLKKYAPGPTKVRVCNGNFDFEKTGDTAYRKWVESKYDPDLLLRQEVVRGQDGVRVRGYGIKAFFKRLVPLGRIGSHRSVRFASIIMGSEWVDVGAAHALHKGTVGPEAHREWLLRLKKRLDRRTKRGRKVILGIDSNYGEKKFQELLGRDYDVTGDSPDFVVTSREGLRTRLVAVDRTPVREGWSNHPLVVVDVMLV